MNSVAQVSRDSDDAEFPRDRAGLVRQLGRLCDDVKARSYLLLDLGSDGDEACILACNWVFDSIRSVGTELVRRVADNAVTTVLGQPPRLWHPFHEALGKSFLSEQEAALLTDAGHAEIASARLKCGRKCYAILYSAPLPRTIDIAALPSAYLSLSYALSALAGVVPASGNSPISERERECLLWVSEGKTAEEVATIVGVTANTVNTYVNTAIRKLSARNRAMAIATAIRMGLI